MGGGGWVGRSARVGLPEPDIFRPSRAALPSQQSPKTAVIPPGYPQFERHKSTLARYEGKLVQHELCDTRALKRHNSKLV